MATDTEGPSPTRAEFQELEQRVASLEAWRDELVQRAEDETAETLRLMGVEERPKPAPSPKTEQS